MEVVPNNYLPVDQRLVDKLVYELKAQGTFDQFRKECIADVDTKPAYQNLSQRVEGSVTTFLKEQSWKPDMNKNQVREMLRKRITESGYLETGVERIVDQVVNPKINTVFLPKVEEVFYSHLGIQKPNIKTEQCDLLPTDLEAVSPESEPVDKKDDKSTDTIQDLDESKTEEDESPPFEPLDEQITYVPQEENSVDSHLSGFSGLASHESNQSNENKVTPMEQDSQMSRNSSDSRLSIVTSDENTKMDICEDSQKSVKSSDSNHKHDDKNKHKSSRSDKDKDRKSSKDSKSRHSTSSRDKDKSRDRKDSKSTTNTKNDKDKPKDRDRKSSTSKHSSHSNNKDKNVKKDSSKSDKDKSKSSSSYKDSKSRDSKPKDKSSDRHKHSSSHSDRHKKDKDKKKDTKPKDDHYSSRDKKNDRRSTDRDSNDGQSSRPPATLPETTNPSPQKPQESNSSGDSGNTTQTENTTKAPVIITGAVESSEVMISPPERVKVLKPKCASNIQEALKLRKIRKQLAKLEKQNQLSLASVDVTSPIVLSSSIDLGDLNQNSLKKEPEVQNTVVSQDNWDAMEAKLREEVVKEMIDCRYFESVDIKKNEFLQFVERLISDFEKNQKLRKRKPKRKIEDNDLKNNNKVKKPRVVRNKTRINNHAVEKFPLPLSPAESDKSGGKKEETPVPVKPKRNNVNKVNNQRYSSDDLYKPRPTFSSTRRRSAKNLDN